MRCSIVNFAPALEDGVVIVSMDQCEIGGGKWTPQANGSPGSSIPRAEIRSRKSEVRSRSVTCQNLSPLTATRLVTRRRPILFHCRVVTRPTIRSALTTAMMVACRLSPATTKRRAPSRPGAMLLRSLNRTYDSDTGWALM